MDRRLLGSTPSPLKRVLICTPKESSLEMVMDACPWGLGGSLLVTSSGRILEYFVSPLTNLDLDRFGLTFGDAAGQQVASVGGQLSTNVGRSIFVQAG